MLYLNPQDILNSMPVALFLELFPMIILMSFLPVIRQSHLKVVYQVWPYCIKEVALYVCYIQIKHQFLTLLENTSAQSMEYNLATICNPYLQKCTL